MTKIFSLWTGRFAFLPLPLYSELLFNSRCDTKLGRMQIFVLHWGRSKALCNKHGSVGWEAASGASSLPWEFCFIQAPIYLQGEEGVAFFGGSTEYIDACSLVI